MVSSRFALSSRAPISLFGIPDLGASSFSRSKDCCQRSLPALPLGVPKKHTPLVADTMLLAEMSMLLSECANACNLVSFISSVGHLGLAYAFYNQPTKTMSEKYDRTFLPVTPT